MYRTPNTMYRTVVLLAMAICLAATAHAQTFTERLQRPLKGQGTVTVHHDAAIDALVNGPHTAPAASPKKTTATTPSTPTTAKPAATKETASNAHAKEKPATKAETADNTAKEAPAETVDTRKKVMRNSYKVQGFRVQVFAGGNSRADRQKAEHTGEKIKANIPGEPVYVHFYSPRWICRMGNYRTYEEAHEMLLAVRKLGYKQATIVKGKISVQY